MKQIKALCVFCGSSVGNDPVFVDAGRALGKELAERGITLVYGGGALGVMGALSAAVLEHGGNVIGTATARSDPLDLIQHIANPNACLRGGM